MAASSLQSPPPLAADTLRIIPLGGLGDIGRNMAVLEYAGELLLIDCGVLFPEDDHPGVDLILPGFDAIIDRLDEVVGLVLTHGHEDHIGAVPYLLRQRADIPLVGSKLTLALLAEKFREHHLRDTNQRLVADGDRIRLGGFDLEFIAVNHSIPDSLALAVRTPAGTILHTGDFKADQLPLDGRLTDLRAFARMGTEGVDLFMVDSTNAEIPGFVTPERDISPVAGAGLRPEPATGDRGLLRLPCAPGAAGARRRRGPWPQGRLRRPLDGPQHGRGPRAGLPAGARQHLDRAAGHRELPSRAGGDHLDRLPGRAAVGVVPDGQPGAPGGHSARAATRWCWPALSSRETRARYTG